MILMKMRMILISICGHFNENDSQMQQILLKKLNRDFLITFMRFKIVFYVFMISDHNMRFALSNVSF